MHVMVATDGALDATRAASLAADLAGDEGQVTVYTAVDVPRKLLDDIRAATEAPDTTKLQEVTTEYRSSQATEAPPTSWLGDDAVIERYVRSRVAAATQELTAALAAAGVEHEVVGEEVESPADAIIEAASQRHVDVICIGTRGLGRFEGLLGSTSTKVARRAGCAVLLVR